MNAGEINNGVTWGITGTENNWYVSVDMDGRITLKGDVPQDAIQKATEQAELYRRLAVNGNREEGRVTSNLALEYSCKNECVINILRDAGACPEQMLFVEGFDDAIIGIAKQFGKGHVICYDLDLVLNKMMERDGITKEVAREDFEYNIHGTGFRDDTPIFVSLPISGLPLAVAEATHAV